MLRVIALLLTALLAEPPATAASTMPSDRAAILALDERELGHAVEPAKTEKLLDAQIALETFFAEPSKRKQIAQQLDAGGIDANELGPLSRLREGWQPIASGAKPIGMHYVLDVPANYERTSAWPLIVSLPEIDDLPREFQPDAVLLRAQALADAMLKIRPDAIVIVPLPDAAEFFGPGARGMRSVIDAIHNAQERVNVDPARITMIGHSRSADAVWNLALHDPTDFAAIAPLAGAASQTWQRVRLRNLSNVHTIIWQDVRDPVLPISASRELVQILRGMKFGVESIETTGQGHSPDDATRKKILDALAKPTRELYPKHISIQSCELEARNNRADWLQIYQPLDDGGEQRVPLDRGHDHLSIYENTWSADAQITGPNAITIRTDNVRALRVYVNDQMISFDKPLTITVDHGVAFSGMVKPSMKVMLDDQLILGRGVRYFTAAVDIDLPLKATQR